MLEIKIYFPPIEMLSFKKSRQNYNKSQKNHINIAAL